MMWETRFRNMSSGEKEQILRQVLHSLSDGELAQAIALMGEEQARRVARAVPRSAPLPAKLLR